MESQRASNGSSEEEHLGISAANERRVARLPLATQVAAHKHSHAAPLSVSGAARERVPSKERSLRERSCLLFFFLIVIDLFHFHGE